MSVKKSCDNCLYYKKNECERMVPIGGMPQPLPKENTCRDWSKKNNLL